jgi:hypothetical protein
MDTNWPFPTQLPAAVMGIPTTGDYAEGFNDACKRPAPPPECKTEAEQIAYAFGWWKALEEVRTKQPAQEPVAWITQAGVLTKTDTKAQGELYGWTPLYTTPPAQPAQEPNNFCPRCGKRLQGVLGQPQMHTCTPPLWGHK